MWGIVGKFSRSVSDFFASEDGENYLFLHSVQ